MTLTDIQTEPISQFMSINEVASRLNISKRTVQRYIEREDNPLPAVYLSDRTIRIPWEQFKVWIDSMQEK